MSVSWSVVDHSVIMQALKKGLIEHEASNTRGAPRWKSFCPDRLAEATDYSAIATIAATCRAGGQDMNTGPKTGDNGNAMFQSYISKLITKRNRLKIRSYRRYGEHGKKMFVFPGLFVHAAVRGGTCAFTLKIVNTLMRNSSRDDRTSIST